MSKTKVQNESASVAQPLGGVYRMRISSTPDYWRFMLAAVYEMNYPTRSAVYLLLWRYRCSGEGICRQRIQNRRTPRFPECRRQQITVVC